MFIPLCYFTFLCYFKSASLTHIFVRLGVYFDRLPQYVLQYIYDGSQAKDKSREYIEKIG